MRREEGGGQDGERGREKASIRRTHRDAVANFARYGAAEGSERKCVAASVGGGGGTSSP